MRAGRHSFVSFPWKQTTFYAATTPQVSRDGLGRDNRWQCEAACCQSSFQTSSGRFSTLALAIRCLRSAVSTAELKENVVIQNQFPRAPRIRSIPVSSGGTSCCWLVIAVWSNSIEKLLVLELTCIAKKNHTHSNMSIQRTKTTETIALLVLLAVAIGFTPLSCALSEVPLSSNTDIKYVDSSIGSPAVVTLPPGGQHYAEGRLGNHFDNLFSPIHFYRLNS